MIHYLSLSIINCPLSILNCQLQPKPLHLTPQYGAQFADRSVASAYPFRPPYPDETFEILSALAIDTPRHILDLGAGTGDIARRLAPRVEMIDAVDPSEAMIARGRALPGGDNPRINWIVSSAEEFDYTTRYSLVVAAESLHWMEWDVVLPLIKKSLSPNGKLAIVNRRTLDEHWSEDVWKLIAEYSTNRDYIRYDLIEELAIRNLFIAKEVLTTKPMEFSQSIDDYIESFHSRNGFSRQRMGDDAEKFDRAVRDLVTPFAHDGMLPLRVIAEVVIGGGWWVDG